MVIAPAAPPPAPVKPESKPEAKAEPKEQKAQAKPAAPPAPPASSDPVEQARLLWSKAIDAEIDGKYREAVQIY